VGCGAYRVGSRLTTGAVGLLLRPTLLSLPVLRLLVLVPRPVFVVFIVPLQ
jgi:hypothetical protein